MKKKINVAVVALFLIFTLGFGAAFWIVPDRDFSDAENRRLQTLPHFSLEAFLDGSLSEKLTNYYSDQFPLRDGFVGLHGLGEIGLFRGESNGVLWGKNGQLAVRRFDAYESRTERIENTDYYNPAHVQAGLDALARLENGIGQEIPLNVLLAPRTIDVTAHAFRYPDTLSLRLHETIRQTLEDGGVNAVDLFDSFRDFYDQGSYIYYRTDHHWTTRGAYYAYAEVMRAMDMGDQIVSSGDFHVREVPDFYGTTYSRAGLYFIPPDTLEIWEAADGSDRDFIVRDADGNPVIEQGFINESYLESKDKYGAFLDGTHNLLTVTRADGTPRPRLLLAKDSFANSMVPFLARHFDLVICNLSGGMTDLTELAKTHDCDRILVVCNWENLITSDCVAVIK